MTNGYQQQLEAAHTEREVILGRLQEIFDELKLENPPSLTPISSEGASYSDDATPVVVISLNGLRRLEAFFVELQQRRQEAEEAKADA